MLKNIDVIHSVGDSQYKDKNKSDNCSIYFNSDKYSVHDKLQKELEGNCNMIVQQKFKSKSYLKLSKDLQDACGQCGFNITQNDNQKFPYVNSSWL